MSSRHKRERIGAGRFFLLWVRESFPFRREVLPFTVAHVTCHGKNKTYNKTKRTNGKTTAIHGKSQGTHGKTTPIFHGGSEKPRRKWEATAEVKCHGGCNLSTTSSWIMAESVEVNLECEYLELPEDDEVLRVFRIHFSKQFLYNDARYSSSSQLHCVPYWPVSK